ncbi:MAG: hypothetical protein ACT4N8_10865 [Sphingosinicella sp.]|uniref:hypothetical protein n=1 Tax=Sphingosinicella sp. TaxID=1917971 RepID=UPI004037C131
MSAGTKSTIVAIIVALVALWLLVAVIKFAFKLLAVGIVVALGIGAYVVARRMIGGR